MPDTEWTRGKCGFKALLYMACGVPPVCSPVGMTTDIVQDGENGLLATTTEEWIEKLSLLVENPTLRRQMGEAGRTTVEEKFSLTTHAPRFLETLQRTAAIGRPQATATGRLARAQVDQEAAEAVEDGVLAYAWAVVTAGVGEVRRWLGSRTSVRWPWPVPAGRLGGVIRQFSSVRARTDARRPSRS